MNFMNNNDSFRVLRIALEFAKGFRELSHIGRRAVTVFGSARTHPDDPNYKTAVEVGRFLAQNGYAVITGGGSGIMEATNKGAASAGGISIGLNIDIPNEQIPNRYINKLLNFRYFFSRKVMLIRYSRAFIALPGGFGTLDECLELLTLIQTEKIKKFPVILINSTYWSGFLEWIHDTVLKAGNINAEDLNLITVVDTAEEAINVIHKFYAPVVTSIPG